MKFALCNEVLQGLSIEEGFSKIAEIGYQGVEIAPFTLNENPLEINESDAERCVNAAKSAGIEIVGLHWLMAKTEGLHITHSDEGMRRAACDYLKKLTRLTAQMGGTIMVLGSPQQRNLEHGTVYEDAFARAVEIIREVCELAGEMKVKSPLLLNPSPQQKPVFFPPVPKPEGSSPQSTDPPAGCTST